MSINKEMPGGNAPEMTAKLGKTINRLRRAYKYSLGDLSEQSGVAKSIISQIEKNETNPTLSTVYKLARALNAPIEDILRSDDAPALIEKLGPSGTPLLMSDDGLVKLRIVGWIKTIELVQWYYYESEPGGVLESEPHPPGSVENLTVLEGEVAIVVGHEEFRLSAGETARYAGDVPHRITNTGKKTAKAMMINLLGPVTATSQSLSRGLA